MTRNRIRTVPDGHPQIGRPVTSDLSGVRGKAWMKRAALPESGRRLPGGDLQLHELLESRIRRLGQRIGTDNADNAGASRLRTLPGVGRVPGPVIALETGGAGRFRTPGKFCAHAGLAPTTRAAGGKVSHGRMPPFRNRWLKRAFIAAAWPATGCSDCFGSFHKRHRARGKGANGSITITARRPARIAWKIPAEKRGHAGMPPEAKTLSPATALSS
jgi:transposase